MGRAKTRSLPSLDEAHAIVLVHEGDAHGLGGEDRLELIEAQRARGEDDQVFVHRGPRAVTPRGLFAAHRRRVEGGGRVFVPTFQASLLQDGRLGSSLLDAPAIPD